MDSVSGRPKLNRESVVDPVEAARPEDSSMRCDPGATRPLLAAPLDRNFHSAPLPDVLQRDRRALHAASSQHPDDSPPHWLARKEFRALAIQPRRLGLHAVVADRTSPGIPASHLLSARSAPWMAPRQGTSARFLARRRGSPGRNLFGDSLPQWPRIAGSLPSADL